MILRKRFSLEHVKRASDFLLSFFATLLPMKEAQCDILFLHFWEGGIENRKALSFALECSGFKVYHHVLRKSSQVIRHGLQRRTKRVASRDFMHLEFYAAWIVRRYRPRIILTFMNDMVISIFLKKEMDELGGIVVNIAHGLTLATDSFTMFHCHYYFVFGQSSLEAVVRQKTRYGCTKIVKVGSYLITPDFTLPIKRKSSDVVFFSNYAHPSDMDKLARYFRIFGEWASGQSQFRILVKHHPAEDVVVTRSMLAGVPNLVYLPNTVGVKEALTDAAFGITGCSNVAIEMAVLNRNILLIDDGYSNEEFEFHKYLPPPCKTGAEVDERIDQILTGYEHWSQMGKRLVSRHLERTVDSIPFIVHCLSSIAKGREDFEYKEVQGTSNYFSDVSERGFPAAESTGGLHELLQVEQGAHDDEHP